MVTRRTDRLAARDPLWFVDLGLLRVLGAGFVLVALFFHRSESPSVLGRWSPAYATFLAAVAVVVLTLAAASATAVRRQGPPTALGRWRFVVRWLDLAVALVGAGYLAGTVRLAANAGRLLDGTVIGSRFTEEILLGWLALACVAAGAVEAARRVRPQLAGPMLMLAAVTCAIVILEGMARVAAVAFPQIQRFPTYRASIWRARFVRVNDEGFREQAHALRVDDRTRRLLVIGDSYAYGYGLERLDDRFGEQLGRAISDSTASRWEVITAARPDTHTRDHFGFLETGLRYKPDMVILLYVFNDIDYLIPVTRRLRAAEHPQTLGDRLHPLRVAMANSFLAQEIYVRWPNRRPTSAPPAPDPYSDSSVLSMHLDDVSEFGRRIASEGVPWLIVPFDVSVANAPSRRQRYARFVDALSQRSLPVWSLLTAFDGRTVQELVINKYDGHPSATANRLAAMSVLGRAVQAVDRR